jgi:WD40 repeat protein
MGVVYLAREIALNRWVALKVVVGGVFAGDEALERFQREAEAVAALQHPNIIQIFNVGVSSATGDGGSACPYIALEYADGGTLAAHTGKPMQPRLAAELVATLAEAVQYAHSRGIVHRDLKPGNVLMRIESAPHGKQATILSRLTPKVTDFGLAKRVNDDGSTTEQCTTVAGSTLGTPEYMAPEQAQGHAKIGPAADIYSLGVILFELLTARVPLQGADALDTLVRVRTQEAPLPSRLQARLPRDLDTICSRCLQKDPSRRYASAQALADDLRAWIDHRPILARPTSRVERLWKWAKRRPAVAALLATVLLVAAAGFVGVFWQWQRAEARAIAERAAQERASNALAQAENNLYFGRISVAQRELAIGNPWDAMRLLNLCRPAEGSQDWRGWEWHYLKNASRGELLSFQASEHWVWDVAYSPDGTQLATAAGSPFADDRENQPGELCLWDAATGKLLHKFEGPAATVLRVAFSPDGKRLCSADFAGSLRVWDIASGEEICRPQSCHVGDRYSPINFGDAGPCWFTPDGSAVEFRRPDEGWSRLDIATGQVTAVAPMAGVSTQSSDGQFQLKLVDGPNIEVVTRESQQTVGRLSLSNWSNRFAVGSDGNSVLLSQEGNLEFFETVSGRRLKTYDCDGSWIESVAFSPDGKKFAVGGSGRSVFVWSDKFQQPTKYSGHTAEVRRVAFSPDGQRLASCDRAGRIMVWDLARNPQQQLIHVGVDSCAQWAIGLSADGETVLEVWSNASVIHFHRTGRRLKDFKIQGLTKVVQYPRYDVSFSPDGTQLVGPSDEQPATLRQWNADTGDIVREYAGHSRPIMGTAWSRDGQRLATRATDRKDSNYVTEVCVWDALSGVRVRDLTDVPIMGMALSSTGRYLAGATRRGEVIVWDVDNGREVWRGLGHQPNKSDSRSAVMIFNLAFSPDDQYLASVGFSDGTVQLWDAVSGAKLHDALPARPPLTGVAFTPDSRRVVAAGYDSEVRMWDVATGRLAITLRAPTGSRRGDMAYTARPMFSLRNQQLCMLDWSGMIAIWNGKADDELAP